MKENKMVQVFCPYCMNAIMVEATGNETQEQLIEKAAISCNCDGARGFRRESRIRSTIENDLESKMAVDSVMDMIQRVKNEDFSKVTLMVDNITYNVTTNADGILKFQRKVNTKEEMTL